MGRIHVLDDAVINKIAAGEVVERPASVVKEMVENAIDAGATAVVVTLAQGGTTQIIVSDNGSGMDREDAFLALKRHATSKIASVDDLFTIQTMGFRGEALASIASVSRFSLSTVQAGESTGIKLETAGGSDISERAWSGPQGTTICAEDLFFNVPARAKFLKAPATELSYCHELIQSFALCHPHVGLTLIHNQKEIFRVPPVAEAKLPDSHPSCRGEEPLRLRARAALGKEAEALMYVTAESRYGFLEALISPPGLEKATGKHLFTFVNGRWVKDKTLRYGVLRGYHSHLMKGRFPLAIVHLTMDPALVDVNAHPAKTEVRFQYPSEVQSLIALAIREKIRTGQWAKAPAETLEMGKREGLLPKPNPKALLDDGVLARLSAADPSMDISQEGEPLDERASMRAGASKGVAHHSRDQRLSTPSAEGRWQTGYAVRQGQREQRDDGDCPSLPDVKRTSSFFGVREVRPLLWEQPGDPRQSASSRSMPPLAPVVDKASLDALLKAAPAPLGPGNFETRDKMSDEPPQSAPRRDPEVTTGGLMEPSLLSPSYSAVKGASPIPWDEMTYVGVFDRCFLMFEGGGRLLVVDQHAFHERILFEKLLKDGSLLKQSQRLLVPEALDLAATDVAHLMEHHHALKDRGFDYQQEGLGTLVVTAVPSILAGRDLGSLFSDLAAGLRAEPGGQEPGDSNGELARLVLATTACHGAVKAGEELPPHELKQLIASARGVDFVENCPHGRRVFKWWNRNQVAGWFDR